MSDEHRNRKLKRLDREAFPAPWIPDIDGEAGDCSPVWTGKIYHGKGHDRRSWCLYRGEDSAASLASLRLLCELRNRFSTEEFLYERLQQRLCARHDMNLETMRLHPDEDARHDAEVRANAYKMAIEDLTDIMTEIAAE